MWLDRLNKMIDINKFKNKTVLIIGLGGVGGSALESIVRMGINNIIVIDNDIIDITNLNRQLLSLNSNIGKFKIDVAKKRALDINPNCNIVTINKFIDSSNILDLFNYNIDYVIDACDTITTKILLIEGCIKENIKMISCMGTGNKFHPELLEIMELKNTTYDPIAKVLRNKLKNIDKKIMVVCSKEKPMKIADEIGSNSLVPNAAGILCASYVINDILKEE